MRKTRTPKRLTAAFCRTVQRPGYYGDGGHGSRGLQLRVHVTKGGHVTRRWIQRVSIAWRTTNIALGAFPDDLTLGTRARVPKRTARTAIGASGKGLASSSGTRSRTSARGELTRSPPPTCSRRSPRSGRWSFPVDVPRLGRAARRAPVPCRSRVRRTRTGRRQRTRPTRARVDRLAAAISGQRQHLTTPTGLRAPACLGVQMACFGMHFEAKQHDRTEYIRRPTPTPTLRRSRAGRGAVAVR